MGTQKRDAFVSRLKTAQQKARDSDCQSLLGEVADKISQLTPGAFDRWVSAYTRQKLPSGLEISTIIFKKMRLLIISFPRHVELFELGIKNALRDHVGIDENSPPHTIWVIEDSH